MRISRRNVIIAKYPSTSHDHWAEILRAVVAAHRDVWTTALKERGHEIDKIVSVDFDLDSLSGKTFDVKDGGAHLGALSQTLCRGQEAPSPTIRRDADEIAVKINESTRETLSGLGVEVVKIISEQAGGDE